MNATRISVRGFSSLGLFALALLLASCTEKTPEPDLTYTVGATVSGLAGTGLVLQNNGGNNLAVSANGAFTFSTAIARGGAYSVTVSTHPTNPVQTCTVTNGSGTVGSANVTNVAVSCVTNTYTIGGNVGGLSGTGLVLQNNGGNNLAVSANGAFTFSIAIASGSAYAVTVFTQPTSPSQTCTVTNGSGPVGSANVSNVAVACVNNIFHVIDSNSGVGVPGVDAYLDGGAAPIGTTDATGSMSFTLTGVHSVHFYKAGYFVNSRVNRDWTAVSGTETVLTRPYPGGTTTGTVSGTIFNTAAGDGNIRVISRRSSDGFSSFSFPLATAPSTPYSLAALVGTSDLFVIPNSTSFPAAASFAGYSPGVAVPSTVNPSLVRSDATSFAVTGIGGFPAPGSINASYGVPTNRFSLGLDLFTLGSASTSGATLGATVNVPPLNLVYPSAMYKLNVNAFSVPSPSAFPTVANFQARYETRGFPTHADLVAAATTPQNIVLTDDTMSVISPAHNAINVPVSPTFTWSRVGSPDYVEVALFEYDPVRLSYPKVIWAARVYGNTFSVTPPATVTLNPDSFYQYDLFARRDLFDGAGALVGWQRNGWENVNFSTGATTPGGGGSVALPETGQTTCTDATGVVIACAGTGQDGDLKAGVAWPNPRFTVGTGATVDCVTDNLTGLMWVRAPSATAVTWAAALAGANALTLCGFSDWRLPNRKELRSLINYGVADNAASLNGLGFSNVQPDFYWSSSSYAGNAASVWIVGMVDGIVFANLKSGIGPVWPVRAGQ